MAGDLAIYLSRFQAIWFELLKISLPSASNVFVLFSLYIFEEILLALPDIALLSRQWIGSCPLAIVGYSLTQSQTFQWPGLANLGLPLKN